MPGKDVGVGEGAPVDHIMERVYEGERRARAIKRLGKLDCVRAMLPMLIAYRSIDSLPLIV